MGQVQVEKLPSGLTCSGDVLQEKTDNVFGNLNGLSDITDDTFSTTRVKQSMISTCWMSLTQHGKTRYGSTLISSSLQEIKQFFGFTRTPDGLRADDLKIKGIRDMPSPQNLAELQTFMGVVNYLNWFFSIMAQTSEPLRQLMNKDTPFLWQPEHHRAFQSLKQIITEAPVLAYYNPVKDNVSQWYASWLCTHARW